LVRFKATDKDENTTMMDDDEHIRDTFRKTKKNQWIMNVINKMYTVVDTSTREKLKASAEEPTQGLKTHVKSEDDP
jgi:hypothetical protein